MTEKKLRNISKLCNDLKFYNTYKCYREKLENLKLLIFNQVLSRLDCFNQDYFSEDDYLYSENYFSPIDLVIELSPSDYDFLVSFKNGKI